MNLENLIKIYNKNVSEIEQLDFYNDSIKRETVELLKKTDLVPYFPKKQEMWSKLIRYVSKELKDEHEEDYDAKAMYNFILDILKEYISKSIKSIDKVVSQHGYSFSLVSYNVYFKVDGKEYMLKFPILSNLNVEDVWGEGGFTDADAKFSLFEHANSIMWTEIWRGADLTTFNAILKED